VADIIGRLAVVVQASAGPLASGLAEAAQASRGFSVGAQSDMNAVAAAAGRMGQQVQQQAQAAKGTAAVLPPPVIAPIAAPVVPPVPPIAAPAVPVIPPVKVNVAAGGLSDAARQAEELALRVNGALGKLDAGGKVGPFVGRVRQLMRDLPKDQSANEFARNVQAALANLKGHDSVTLFTRDVRAALQRAGANLPIVRAAPPLPVAVKAPPADRLGGLAAGLGSVGQLLAALPGGGMFAGLAMQAAGATGAMSGLTSGLGSAGAAAGAAANPIGLIAAAIAAVAAVAVGAAAAVYGWARSVMNAVASQVRLADRIGVSVEGLQRFAFALQAGGVSGEDLASVVNKVQARIGELQDQMRAGGGEMVTAFRRLGINAEAFAAMPLDRQVLALADGLGRVPNAADRAAAAHKLLGRGAYESLGPVLARGRAWIEMQGRIAEGAGAVLPAADARELTAASSALKQAWATFGAVVTGVGNSLALALGPPIKAVADVVNHLFQAAAASGVLKAAVNVLGGALAALGVVAIAFVAVLATPLVALAPLFLTLAVAGWGLWQALKAVWAVGSAVGRVLRSFLEGFIGPLDGVMDGLGAIIQVVRSGFAGLWDVIAPIGEAIGEMVVAFAGVAGALLGFGGSTRSLGDMLKDLARNVAEFFNAVRESVIGFVQGAIDRMMDFTGSILNAVMAMQELRARLEASGPAGRLAADRLLPGFANLDAASGRLQDLQDRLQGIRDGIGRGVIDAKGMEGVAAQVEAPKALEFSSKEAVAAINANITGGRTNRQEELLSQEVAGTNRVVDLLGRLLEKVGNGPALAAAPVGAGGA
jgi:hypothetical protein